MNQSVLSATPLSNESVAAANDAKFGLNDVQTLARAMGYLTAIDICDLYAVTKGTAEAWRKRGIGPRHIMAGNRALYAIEDVMNDLKSRARTTKKAVSAKELL